MPTFAKTGEAFAPVLDSEEDGPLPDTVGRAMNEIKRGCAHWRGELEIDEWIAERDPEEFSVNGRRISVEQAEDGARLLDRSDHLGEGMSFLYKAAEELEEGERWAMLSALYEAKDQVDEELTRFRGDIPPA